MVDSDISPPLGSTKRRVTYIYDQDVSLYMYETEHQMKPFRIKMAHSLVEQYGLYKKMQIFRAKPATPHEMSKFHTDEYVDFLSKISPENIHNYKGQQRKHNLGIDCPVFDGVFEFSSISAGGSIAAATRLARGSSDIAIHWAGGLHHAKKEAAGGFCYINDIVLGILELLRTYKRVLYIDIDVHHGGGVEEAFYTTDRVMTVSFHTYGRSFFPGTGSLEDVGVGIGKNYSVNFPLFDGMNDISYQHIFETTISKVMEYYIPEAVVLQRGADSLSGDELGGFNLSMRGRARCISFVKTFNIPTMILGSGGYAMRNVARTWAYETAVCLDEHRNIVNAAFPVDKYYHYYGPEFKLDVRAGDMVNRNSDAYLQKVTSRIFENMKANAHCPSVEMQDVPRDPIITRLREEEEDRLDDMEVDELKNTRHRPRELAKRVERYMEVDGSDDNNDEGLLLSGKALNHEA